MSVGVLTVTTAEWEARLVARLEHSAGRLHVARRCVDVADLVAAASAGHGQAALLAADLRGLDRDSLGRLRSAGVAPVGVVAPEDEDGERRLRQLGVEHIAVAGAEHSAAADVADVVDAAVAGLAPLVPTSSWLDGLTGGGGATSDGSATGHGFADEVRPGALIAVWGPTGAPGRTTLAVNLAAEIAHLGRATLLADVDTYGGAVAQLLGMLDEAPGLAAAARAANAGQLDLPALARLARQLAPRLRVLTGITRTERWPELRPSSLDLVWGQARGLAEFTVADVGFCLEQDEDLSYDTSAPRRNGATITTLEQADVIVAVGSSDPISVQRLVRGLSDLAEIAPKATVRVVVNRVRVSVVGRDPERQIADALHRYAGVSDVHIVPDDRNAVDQALIAGRMLAEAAPNSPARAAVAGLAASLVGDDAPAGRPARWRRRLRLAD